jgi:hypothetical protein
MQGTFSSARPLLVPVASAVVSGYLPVRFLISRIAKIIPRISLADASVTRKYQGRVRSRFAVAVAGGI